MSEFAQYAANTIKTAEKNARKLLTDHASPKAE